MYKNFIKAARDDAEHANNKIQILEEEKNNLMNRLCIIDGELKSLADASARLCEYEQQNKGLCPPLCPHCFISDHRKVEMRCVSSSNPDVDRFKCKICSCELEDG